MSTATSTKTERRAAKAPAEPATATATGPDVDLDAVAAGHEQLRDAYRHLHELLAAVEADNRKVANSHALIGAKRTECKNLGVDFDPDLAPPPYTGDAALRRELHRQHYAIAALETKLGVRQMPSRP
jgi:hypothetical protein